MELYKLRIGTSGYQSPDWSGTVYPKKLKKKDTLSYYAKALEFDTVELNYTYYTLSSAKTSLAMLDRVPEGFEFVLRSHKDMTHDIWENEKERILKENEAVFKKFYELDELISQIKEVVSKTNKMYIFFNNCPKGQALRNAIMLKKVMGIIKELNPAQEFAMGWKD